MRVLIVDDEAPARSRMRRLLSVFSQVQIVGEACDGPRALQQIAELVPQVVFLDVQMPGCSGLDVAASLPDPAPAVVLVTAFDRYALQAFDAAALDYLLKPVEPERLAQTIVRLTSWLERSLPTESRARPAPEHLLIPDRGRTHVIPVGEILWLEAADNYVIVHTATTAPLMRRTLAGLIDDLGADFIRIHRRFAVALSAICSIAPHGKGDSEVSLSNATVLPCSRQYRASLHERLVASAQEKAAKG